jgi:hypothetical protein
MRTTRRGRARPTTPGSDSLPLGAPGLGLPPPRSGPLGSTSRPICINPPVRPTAGGTPWAAYCAPLRRRGRDSNPRLREEQRFSSPTCLGSAAPLPPHLPHYLPQSPARGRCQRAQPPRPRCRASASGVRSCPRADGFSAACFSACKTAFHSSPADSSSAP